MADETPAVAGVPWYLSKTLWFNVATLLVSLATTLPPEYAVVTATIGNILLRYLTNQPVTFPRPTWLK